MHAFLAREGYSGGQHATALMAKLRSAPRTRIGELELAARRRLVLSFVAMVRTLNAQIQDLEREIRTQVRAHPDGRIFLSLFKSPRRRSPANEGQLVANWVDVCSEFVCAAALPDRWPHTVAVDSQNFRVRSGPNAGRGFHVLAAVGRDQGDAQRWAPIPRVWRLEPFAYKDQAARETFLGALDGAHRVIVSDADHALALAIGSVFGESGIEHRQCEWHLSRKLRHHLPEEVLGDRAHPITCALRDAFHSTEAWLTLEQAIRAEHAHGEAGPLGLAIKWLATYGQIAEAEIPTRDPHGINSTGPVEQVLREIDRRIGDRVGSFTNRTRLSKLLDLMTLDLLGKADGRDWADRLRERLYLAGGHPANQRPTTTPKASTPCSSDRKNVSIRIE